MTALASSVIRIFDVGVVLRGPTIKLSSGGRAERR